MLLEPSWSASRSDEGKELSHRFMKVSTFNWHFLILLIVLRFNHQKEENEASKTYTKPWELYWLQGKTYLTFLAWFVSAFSNRVIVINVFVSLVEEHCESWKPFFFCFAISLAKIKLICYWKLPPSILLWKVARVFEFYFSSFKRFLRALIKNTLRLWCFYNFCKTFLSQKKRTLTCFPAIVFLQMLTVKAFWLLFFYS